MEKQLKYMKNIYSLNYACDFKKPSNILALLKKNNKQVKKNITDIKYQTTNKAQLIAFREAEDDANKMLEQWKDISRKIDIKFSEQALSIVVNASLDLIKDIIQNNEYEVVSYIKQVLSYVSKSSEVVFIGRRDFIKIVKKYQTDFITDSFEGSIKFEEDDNILSGGIIIKTDSLVIDALFETIEKSIININNSWINSVEKI
jgi:flagellar biosynthesis/type III secretory pathway protein FliH